MPTPRGAGQRTALVPAPSDAGFLGERLREMLRLRAARPAQRAALRCRRPEGIRAMRAVAPAAQVLFTRGTDGMRLLGEAQEVDRLVYPGSGVDMVGARDACVGAWMASLLTRPGASPADHVSWAAAAATVSCAHVGACAPTREEVDSVCAGTSSPRAGAAGR